MHFKIAKCNVQSDKKYSMYFVLFIIIRAYKNRVQSVQTEHSHTSVYTHTVCKWYVCLRSTQPYITFVLFLQNGLGCTIYIHMYVPNQKYHMYILHTIVYCNCNGFMSHFNQLIKQPGLWTKCVTCWFLNAYMIYTKCQNVCE